jgi:hypothetical protein
LSGHLPRDARGNCSVIWLTPAPIRLECQSSERNVNPLMKNFCVDVPGVREAFRDSGSGTASFSGCLSWGGKE